MNKKFYDAESLLAVCEAIKLKKCTTCASFLMDTKVDCKACEMKFIVDLLQVFPVVTANALQQDELSILKQPVTNFDKLKAELLEMSVDEVIDNVAMCDRIDADIKAKYCKQEGDCWPCCREWLNREIQD